MAKMCYFYRLKPEEVDNLDLETSHILWHGITMIEAREKLNALEVVSYPYAKENTREKIHRKLFKQAYPATFDESKPMDASALAKALRGG